MPRRECPHRTGPACHNAPCSASTNPLPGADARSNGPPTAHRPPQNRHRMRPPRLGNVVWKWERFRRGYGITDVTANIQLLHCLSDPLLAAAKRSLPALENLSVAAALAEIKKIAILSVALAVRQTHELETRQDKNKHFRMFVG